MQVPILKGIFTDDSGEYRSRYPRNMVPVPKAQGVSNGYLRPAEGINHFADVSGVDRGGINWNGQLYRVTGSHFNHISSDGVVTYIGDVGDNGGNVSFTYSFDYLALASDEKLYLYDGNTLAQVTDQDLGVALDVVWIDGYFLTTDGEFVVATDLLDPFSVAPFRYGSSEVDPDPIVGIKKIRNELAVINRYSIEYFDNVGGTVNSFPFQRISGAEVQRGCVGTHASAVFNDALAFIGGRLNEEHAIWIGSAGTSVKLSTREVDLKLREFTEQELSRVIVEARRFRNHNFLYIHLPNETLVFDATASEEMGQKVWHTLDSGRLTPERYKAHNFVFVYEKWVSGDPTSNRIGCMVDDISHHYGEVIGWDFGTLIIYNEAKGALFHEIKLVGLTGRAALGDDPHIMTRHSDDGVHWSEYRRKSVGKRGDRSRDITWYRQGRMRETRLQEFSGTSDAHISVSRLDMVIEGLAH